MGTARGLESRLVPQAGYRLELIRVGQLNRVSLATRLRTLIDLPLGLLQCGRLLRRFRPDAVIGVGGYASGPVMGAAILLGIPTLAFEPNAVPGLANRLIGSRVKAAAVNFEPAARYFRNAHVTGIPVRTEFFQLARTAGRSRAAFVGLWREPGSARAECADAEDRQPRFSTRAGLNHPSPGGSPSRQNATLAAYRESGAPAERWQVAPFLDDMPRRFEAADLVLARSGASTVAELAAAGKPAVLVPLPTAADDHQRKNAEVMAQAGAARVLLEPDLTAEQLKGTLSDLLASPGELRSDGGGCPNAGASRCRGAHWRDGHGTGERGLSERARLGRSTRGEQKHEGLLRRAGLECWAAKELPVTATAVGSAASTTMKSTTTSATMEAPTTATVESARCSTVESARCAAAESASCAAVEPSGSSAMEAASFTAAESTRVAVVTAGPPSATEPIGVRAVIRARVAPACRAATGPSVVAAVIAAVSVAAVSPAAITATSPTAVVTGRAHSHSPTDGHTNRGTTGRRR